MSLMDKLQLPGNFSICGSTMSGKTYLTKRIIKEVLLDNVDYIIILSPTNTISGDFDEYEETNKKYEPTKGHPAIKKFNKNFNSVIDEIVTDNTRLMEDKNIPRKDIPRIALILDDMVGNPLLRFKGKIDKLSTKSRHLNISIFILAQRISAVPRTFRLNSKYTIMFSVVNYSELERFLEECVPKSLRKSMGNNISSIFDEPYNFILCCNFATKISERLYLNGTKPLWEMLKTK